MRTFSSWCMPWRTRKGCSGAAVNGRIPPPCERTRAPLSESASRSPRAVTADTPNRRTTSSTVILPFSPKTLRISRRRSSASNRLGFRLDFPLRELRSRDEGLCSKWVGAILHYLGQAHNLLLVNTIFSFRFLAYNFSARLRLCLPSAVFARPVRELLTQN